MLDRAAAALRNDPVYVDGAPSGASTSTPRRTRVSARASEDSRVAHLRGHAARAPPPRRSAATPTGWARTWSPAPAGRHLRRARRQQLPSGALGPGAVASPPRPSRPIVTTASRRCWRTSSTGWPRPSRPGAAQRRTRPRPRSRTAASPAASGGGGGSSALPLLLLVGAGGAGLWFWSRKRTRTRKAEEQRDRSVLDAQLSVLADDVLEPRSPRHHPSRGPGRLRRRRLAVPGGPGRPRERRRADRPGPGRPPPRRGPVRHEPGPGHRRRPGAAGAAPDLARPGAGASRPSTSTSDGQPAYVGAGSSPFYGGGWFGGGGGLMTGLFLGPDARRRLGRRRPRHQRLRRQLRRRG